MSIDSKTPMALYKANLELVMRIGALLQENRQRWMQAGAAGTSDAIQRTLAQTERLLTSNDWASLSTMPGEDFWKSLQSGASRLQGSFESSVRSQTEFAEGLKQAFAEWQQQSMAVLGVNAMQFQTSAVTDFLKASASAPTHKTSAKPNPAPAAKSKARPVAKAKAKTATKSKAGAPSKAKGKASAKARPAAKPAKRSRK
ncbi:MAG TPA: phasin family protein [Dokdonella sp.]|uniref:phasin family protein n=1 Tax=Dokdonella sp. TaxID=2291710 RepID=UPI002D8043FE|nr:phasin family protein [Dokdonella sp.]HET9032053.1 phasin family protein [Dokdonella sp.]